uniref:ABC transporter C family member 10 n=1 Tax=Oryza rufipogon TaxID=4529 RepID=A0A0E0PTT9_ORYRU
MARETPPAATPRHRHVGVVATWDEVESRDIARSFARCPARATRLAAPRRAPPIINTTRARARPARRLRCSLAATHECDGGEEEGATIGKVFGWRRKEGKKRKRKEKKRKEAVFGESCFGELKKKCGCSGLEGILSDSTDGATEIGQMGSLIMLTVALVHQLLMKIPKSRASARQLVAFNSLLQLAAVVFTGCLGLLNLGLGLWMVGISFNQETSIYRPHWWLVILAQGFSLILTSFSFSIRPRFLGATFVRFWSLLLTICAAFICCCSVVYMVGEKEITIKACLDVLLLPGALILLLYAIRHSRDEEGYETTENALYMPLNTERDHGTADSESHLMSDGKIIRSAPYQDLLEYCQEFQDLVNAHKDTIGISDLNNMPLHREKEISMEETDDIHGSRYRESVKPSPADQLIKKEEREIGDTGLKPYILYLRQNKGFLYLSICVISHIIFISGQISQNSWMAANVQNPSVSTLKLIVVYIAIGVCTLFFLLSRSLSIVVLGMQTSRSLFSQLLNSLFRAPMSFFDSTPLGRVLSRVSSDLSIVDLDVPFFFMFSISASLNAYSNLGVLAVITWQVLFISVPMIVLVIRLQRYYLASAKELMRINGTTKSSLANHLGESISGAITIRAFEEEDRFFAKNLELVDKNAGPCFYNFAATEWLIQRLELMSAAVLSFSALVMVILPPGTFSPGFVGMALSYGLSLNMSLVFSIQNQCNLANQIISVERVNQYMDITSEAAEVIKENRPAPDWPQVGKVELRDLKIKYRQDAPLVLHGITCTFEGGHKIGIVGRTGSGKTTLIGALFRLVEPAGGKIIIDSVDITTIGLHDLRSRLGIIPQDPTLFQGTLRYNLDPLGQFSDQQIWEVLDKCQLLETVQEKEQGLDSLVVEDGSNWSMGQRQLFCLGRALLRRCRILVLDEATASIDNATDAILQKTIRTEFKDCTVITVAHRIPTVMDCTMVLAMSDGKVVEYDKPTKLMETEGSLFRELVKEYWSYASSGNV